MERFIALFQSKREISLLFVGLDGSGKTTLLNRLAGLPVTNSISTVGLNTINIRKGRYDISLLDLGGSESIRDLWEKFYAEAHGIIFVLDSGNLFRILEAKDALQKLINNKMIKDKPILIYANKKDLAESMTMIQINKWFEIEDLLKDQLFHVVRVSAMKNRSVNKGIKWLLKSIGKRYKDLQNKVEKDIEEEKRNRKNEIAEKQSKTKENKQKSRKIEDNVNYKSILKISRSEERAEGFFRSRILKIQGTNDTVKKPKKKRKKRRNRNRISPINDSEVKNSAVLPSHSNPNLSTVYVNHNVQ